jgi:heme exporter protein B
VSGPLATIAMQSARLSLKGGGGAFVGLVFFLAVVTVVPFAVGPNLPLLARIGPAVLWIGALLATLLNLDRLFREDRDDGSLDLLMLADTPLELIVLAKCAGVWLATALPLVVAAPVLGLLLGVEPAPLTATTLTLLAGTPALTLVGAIGAALTTALGRGGLLVAVAVLPFTIPVIIFGVGAATAATATGAGASFWTPFALLAAMTLVSAVVAPVAAAAALRAGMD